MFQTFFLGAGDVSVKNLTKIFPSLSLYSSGREGSGMGII